MHESFMKDLVLKHGPKEFLQRFLVAADAEVRARGVSLSFASLEELLAVNRANADSWRPLLPIFRSDCNDIKPESMLCLLGRNAEGEVVLAQGARLFDWRGTSFGEAASSLRLFYDEPDLWRGEDEAIEVTAPSASMISGLVGYTGAHWCRKDFRHRGLTGITPRITRALIMGLWSVDYVCTIMAEDIFVRGVAARAGYHNVDWALQLKNTPTGTFKAAFLWNDPPGILADLEDWLAKFTGPASSGGTSPQ